MSSPVQYRGTPQHQALLRQIELYYRNDPRILALTIFGSVPRGTWDTYSDLDLDAVIGDDVQIDVLPEVRSLCASLSAIGQRAVLVVPNSTDAADVVLDSLHEFSIRYHPLAATSPNIVESVQLLSGSIPLKSIKAAGTTNVQPRPDIEADPIDRFLRLALAVDREVHRQHFWQALSLLEGMRTIVVEMFTHAQGGGRPYTVFQAQAPQTLHEKLAATLPGSSLVSLQHSFLSTLDIVEHEHAQLGRVHGLSAEQKMVLEKVRQRQQSLKFH
jgi:predicted nucleotidyltransferase